MQGRLDDLVVEVEMLRAHAVVGGGLDELRRLWAKVEDLREREKFY